MKKSTFVVSCDWFAYSCLSDWGVRTVPQLKREGDRVAAASEIDSLFRIDKVGGDPARIERRIGGVYQYKALEFCAERATERNPLFHCSVLMRYMGRDVCHLFYAHKKSPSSHQCIAKVANSLLYTDGWAGLFLSCLRAVGWTHVQVSRVDICCDFEYFVNGRLPLQFARDYLCEPTSTRPSFLRRGSNKVRAQVLKTVRRSLVETLSWGTRESPVQVNMYNKTKELQDVHYKPWIVNKWEANGLCSGKDDAGKLHYIWRVEFSVNPTAIAFREKDRSRVYDWTIDTVMDQAALFETFKVMADRYFKFYFVTKANQREGTAVRALNEVQLFNPSDASHIVPMTLNRPVATGRTERILAKRLRELKAATAQDTEERKAIERVESWFVNISAAKDSAERARNEAILSDFIDGLRLPSHEVQLHPLSAAAARRQATRFAKMILCGKPLGLSEYEIAANRLQEDVTRVRDLCELLYHALPDEAYNTIAYE